MKTGTATVNGRSVVVVVAEVGERWTQVTRDLGYNVREMPRGTVYVAQMGENYKNVTEYLWDRDWVEAAIPGLREMSVNAIVEIG